MKYGYEKKDHRGNIVYPMYPVAEGGCFIAAFIVGNAYAPVSDVTYVSEESCREACDIHNNYHGWKKVEIEEIYYNSVKGRY